MPDLNRFNSMTPVEIMNELNDAIAYLYQQRDTSIYDEENPECFLTGFYYDKTNDKLYFACGEE